MSALEQEVAKLLAPLRQLHETAVSDELLAQAKLDQARSARREIEKMLRAVDPEFHNPYANNGRKNGTNGKRSSGGSTHKYKEERVVEGIAWAQKHAEALNAMNEGEGFFASEVVEMYADAPVPNQSGLSAMFAQLHERGVLHLAKLGGLGGRKYYKVVV